MKPRIVLLSAFVSPLRSGAEACAEEVAARLQDRFDIVIVTARMRRDLPTDDRLPSGVRVRRVGFGWSIDKWLYPLLAPAAAAALHPAVIHAVLESFAGLALVFSKNILPNAKRILTCQSTNTSLFLRSMHKAADRITAISSVLVERAKKFGFKAELIPNGVHLKSFQQAITDHKKIKSRILFVGRLEQMKGVDTVVESFLLARKENPTISLHVVGGGSLFVPLREKYHGSNGVVFLGALVGGSLLQEFAQAEIFCGLSRSEALGNVFLEAQAAGCAVVATNVGGIPDIVKDGETGLLVAPGSFTEAAGAIERLLTDGTLRARLSEAGKANAAGYDWGVIAQKYGAEYDALLLSPF